MGEGVSLVFNFTPSQNFNWSLFYQTSYQKWTDMLMKSLLPGGTKKY